MHVIIVGAGAAGLSAVRTIAHVHPQWRITVLEARARPGGRTHTIDLAAALPSLSDTLHVELGGEFIHGGNTSTASLASELGLTLVPVPRYAEMKYNTASCHHTENLKLAELKEVYEKLIHQPVVAEDYTKSLMDDLRHHAPHLMDEVHTADVLFAQTWCADINRLCLGDLREEAEVDVAGSDEYRLLEGYAELWRRVIAEFPDSVTIKYNTTVTGISHQSQSHSITISTTNDCLQCDAVIVTVPSAVLPSLCFSPQLPHSTAAALKSLRTAPATKAILLLRYHPCLEPLKDMTYLCSDDPGMHIPRWWTPKHGMTTPSIKTNDTRKEVIVVCGYATDSRAEKFDSLTEDEAREAVVSDVSRFLLLSPSEISQNVEYFMRVSWAQDCFARGGYASMPAMETAPLKNVSMRRCLAQSIYDNRLWFAGEASAHWSNRQTVHGAFDQGKRAAEELLETFCERL